MRRHGRMAEWGNVKGELAVCGGKVGRKKLERSERKWTAMEGEVDFRRNFDLGVHSGMEIVGRLRRVLFSFFPTSSGSKGESKTKKIAFV
jgi:hypothetical protein